MRNSCAVSEAVQIFLLEFVAADGWCKIVEGEEPENREEPDSREEPGGQTSVWRRHLS